MNARRLYARITGVWVSPDSPLPIQFANDQVRNRYAFNEFHGAIGPVLVALALTLIPGLMLTGLVLLAINR